MGDDSRTRGGGSINTTVGAMIAALAGGIVSLVVTVVTTTTLKITEQAAPSLSASGQAVVYADSTSHKLQVSNNGGAYGDLGSAVANPTGVITGAAVNGSATTSMRSDGAPKIGAALTTADALADVKWSPTATTQKALMLQGLAAQTANVFEVQGSNGTVVFAVDVPPTTFTGTNALIAGSGAMAAATDADNTVALGVGALDGVTSGDKNTAVGKDALGSASSGAMADSTGVGYQAGLVNTAIRNTFLGSSAGVSNVGGTGQCMAGWSAGGLVTGNNNTIFGASAAASTLTSGTDNVIIGSVATAANVSGQIVIGSGAAGTAANQFVVGASAQPSTNWHGGKGVVDATATAYTINGTGGSGSDNAGADVYWAGGKGTGLAGSGYIGITYPLLTTTGSTLQTMSTLKNWVGGFIYVSTADLTLTASTATTGTLIGAQTNAVPQGTLTLDAQLLRVARVIRITAQGRITQSAAGPTLTIAAKLGSTVVATGTIPANAAGITNGAWRCECTLVCRSTGASGTVQGDGTITVDTTAGTVNDLVGMYQAVTTIDTTASQVIDLFGTWSANTAGNNILDTNVLVEFK